MALLDFCCNCGSWVAADTGTIRQGSDDEPEIICDECMAIEQSRAVPVGHDHKSGSLDNG